MSEDKLIKIRPVIAILCDDVRQENNNKPFIIGMYLGGMNLEYSVRNNDIPKDSANLNVYLWMPFQATETGKVSAEIQILGPSINNKLKAKINIDIDTLPMPTEITPIALGPLPLKIWENGEIKILFKNDGDNDFEILRIIPVSVNLIQSSQTDNP